jgi:integrase
LAAYDWRDPTGLTWLEAAPKIRFLPESDRRKPYPMSWEEQGRLLRELPPHLQRMALFKVNTGCREAEVCSLHWDWEIMVPELHTSVFLIPSAQVKNREERLVVLNRIARSVIDEQRGQHSKFVFTYKGCAVQRMNGNAWRKARKRAGLPEVRVHDLKHTFGRRLRAAGVSFEDRQDLLGHKSGRITTHYSAAELRNLIEAANRVSEENSRKSPALTILNRKTG